MKKPKHLKRLAGLFFILSQVWPHLSEASTNLQVSEQVISLGMLNGTVNSNQFVEVSRVLSQPVLFQAQSASQPVMPTKLVIRNAKVRKDRKAGTIMSHYSLPSEKGMGRDVQVTVELTLLVNGKKVPLNGSDISDNVEIVVPAGSDRVELRSDGAVVLLLPEKFRGEVNIPLEVEGMG